MAEDTNRIKVMFHLNCLAQGGAERVVSNLANQFARSGHEVTVATEWIDQNEFKLDDNVKRIVVGLTPEDEKKNRVSQFFARVRHLRECVREEKPDVVVAFAQRAVYRALMAERHEDVPVVISIRTDPVGHYDSFADKLQIHWLFPGAAGAVFQTDGQREFFRRHFGEDNSRIILNPVNDKYCDLPVPEKRTKRVVQSGRLVDFKNQPLLIDAFMDVHAKHPDYILEIYGPDSGDGTKEILEKKIAGYNAGGFIKLMGGSDSLEKQLPDAAVYAFSSDWEGLPNALIEAMAMGLPVVATDCPCGGPREIISDGENGLLVPVKDRKAMADGICRLIEDPGLAERLGTEAREIKDRVAGWRVYAMWDEFLCRCVASDKHHKK